MSEPNELPRTCEACTEVRKDVDGIHARLEAAEHSISRIREGFPKNDLGLPDYDGHRTDHKVRMAEAKVVEGYKRDATKRIIDILIGGVAVIFGLGFIEWIKGHLK